VRPCTEYAPFGDLSRALRKRQSQRKLLPEAGLGTDCLLIVYR